MQGKLCRTCVKEVRHRLLAVVFSVLRQELSSDNRLASGGRESTGGRYGRTLAMIPLA